MSFVMETDDEIDGGGDSQYLSEAGTYHCLVTDIAEGQGPKGNPMNGFTVSLSVLAGTTGGQEDKQTSLCLFSPDDTKSDKSNEWARKKQTAFAVSTGLIDLSKLGGKVSVELSESIGRQIVINFEINEYEGKSKLQVAFANIYHVDDPRAAKFPKSKEALDLIDKNLRKPASYFDSLLKKSAAKTAPKLSNADLADL